MIVDVNTYLGHFPWRRIPVRDAASLKALLARTGTDVALTTPLHAIFYKDPFDGVEEAWEEVRAEPALPLLGVLNPAFPGWRRDLDRCLALGVRGLRLFPPYHAYRLTDEPAAALLGEAQRQRLPVVLSLRLWDERLHHPTNLVPATPVADVAAALERFPDLQVLIASGTYEEARRLEPHLRARADGGFEISYLKTPTFALEALVDLLGPERVLYGSGAPLNYPESAFLRVTMGDLAEAARASILGGNAARLFRLAPAATGSGAAS